MKKNTIIYIVVGAIALVGLAAGGFFVVKSKNIDTANGTTENTWNYNFGTETQAGQSADEPVSGEPFTNEAGEVVEFVTDKEGNTYEAVLETNIAGEVVTGTDGEKVTVSKKPYTTAKPGATAAPSVTQKPSGNKKPASNNSVGGLSTGDKVSGSNTVEVNDDGTANIVKSDGTIALSYSYDATGKYFYTDDDPWQRKFGFNRLYDMGAVFTVMYLDTVHVYYSYGDYDWMLQMWKGQYGFLFVGSEIGLYYKQPGKSTAHYNCAEEDMEIMMQMTLHRDGYGELFTRPYKSHWWTTAFVPGKLKKFSDRSELTMVAKLTFNSESEAIAFCNGLVARTDVDGNRFKPSTSVSKNNPETYVRKGATVDIVWRYLDDDRVTPTKVTTTAKPEDTTPVLTTQAPTTTEAPTTEKQQTPQTAPADVG